MKLKYTMTGTLDVDENNKDMYPDDILEEYGSVPASELGALKEGLTDWIDIGCVLENVEYTVEEVK